MSLARLGNCSMVSLVCIRIGRPPSSIPGRTEVDHKALNEHLPISIHSTHLLGQLVPTNVNHRRTAEESASSGLANRRVTHDESVEVTWNCLSNAFGCF